MTDREKRIAEIGAMLNAAENYNHPMLSDIAFLLSELREYEAINEKIAEMRIADAEEHEQYLRRARHDGRAEAFEEACKLSWDWLPQTHDAYISLGSEFRLKAAAERAKACDCGAKEKTK